MRRRRQTREAAPDGPSVPLPEVGLCSSCANAATQPNARGSVFWRCRAADEDDRLPRYPPLPVDRCHAWTPGRPEGPRQER